MKASSSHALPKVQRPADLTKGEKQKLSIICVLSLIFAILSVARAAHSAAAAAPVSNQQVVKSAFINTPSFGKDPFFPNSVRRGPVTQTNSVEIVPTQVPTLNLKGTSGPKGHRLAIINNRTFEVGEEADIRTAGQVLHVKCVEIRDDGVTLNVNGQTQKLSLGQNSSASHNREL